MKFTLAIFGIILTSSPWQPQGAAAFIPDDYIILPPNPFLLPPNFLPPTPISQSTDPLPLWSSSQPLTPNPLSLSPNSIPLPPDFLPLPPDFLPNPSPFVPPDMLPISNSPPELSYNNPDPQPPNDLSEDHLKKKTKEFLKENERYLNSDRHKWKLSKKIHKKLNKYLHDWRPKLYESPRELSKRMRKKLEKYVDDWSDEFSPGEWRGKYLNKKLKDYLRDWDEVGNYSPKKFARKMKKKFHKYLIDWANVGDDLDLIEWPGMYPNYMMYWKLQQKLKHDKDEKYSDDFQEIYYV